MLLNNLNDSNDNIALIPSMDLLKNTDLFVSKKLGLGYDGFLTNSYLYFSTKNENIDKLFLKGDVSKNEVILSKIILKERYSIEPEILLDTNENQEADNNYLITGNFNWQKSLYKKGISFDEQIADLLEYPYLNFIFVSHNKELLEEFNNKFYKLNEKINSNLDVILEKIDLSSSLNDYIKQQISSIFYSLTENEIEGLQELFKLAYYHQIIDNIFDIKFV